MITNCQNAPAVNYADDIRDCVEKALEIHEDRNAQPFDGILGVPPEWFPERDKLEFRRLRNTLLDTPYYGDEITPQAAVAWLDDWDEIHQGMAKDGTVVFNHSIPIELTETISKLAFYRSAAVLDDKRGLLLLGSADAVRGRKVISGARSGHEAVHGTDKEKTEKWNRFMSECLEVFREHPDWNVTRIREKVAKSGRAGFKTIERHTPSLREKIAELKK